jgi:hypothetical protein
VAVDFDKLVLGPLMDPSTGFGEDWHYTTTLGRTFTLQAVFDEIAHAVIFDHDSAGISTVKPMLGVQLSQVPPGIELSQGDTVRRAATRQKYKVTDVNPDGIGHARLPLMLLK